jgi:hypothetical protein
MNSAIRVGDTARYFGDDEDRRLLKYLGIVVKINDKYAWAQYRGKLKRYALGSITRGLSGQKPPIKGPRPWRGAEPPTIAVESLCARRRRDAARTTVRKGGALEWSLK